MPRVVYVQDDGSEQIVEGQIGQSVMEIAVDAGVEGIVAECGGNMMCATCHVYVDGGWIDKVGAVDDGQNAMLQETAAPRLENSRLSCQLLLSEQIDGLRVRVPPEQV